MNDYAFGNKLFRLRKAAGLTQSELAAKVGVTNKAVSKWENGASKPTTTVVRKLAGVYGISVGELLTAREERDAPVSSAVRKRKGV